jgi:drug/metabolite transporter (DMT)-like permease
MKRLAESGYFLVAFAAIGFSFKAILVKFAYGYGVFLATLFFLEGIEAFRVKVRDLLLFAFMGIIGIGFAMLFSFYSIELIDASLSTLVVFSYPAMTVLLLMIFLKEKLAPLKMFSLVATFMGLIFVLRVDRADFLVLNKRGIICALMAALSFAIYNALSERAMKEVTPIRLISYCVIFLVGFFGFFYGNRPYPDLPEVWAIAAILGIFTGFLPFLCFMYGIKRIGAGKAVIISSLGPALTVIWAAIFLDERLDMIQIVGMALIVTGVMILKLRNPVRLVTGTGDEFKQKIGNIVKERSPAKRAFAFLYLPGGGKKRED